MKYLIITLTLSVFTLSIFAQCDPALAAHYNMGDFPFTSSTGVSVNMAGTNSGVLGPYTPYGCSPAICEANTIRLDPGDTLIFNFSQTVYDLTFVSGVMNPTENGLILSNNGVPNLSSNCPTDLQIVGNAFTQVGALASPVITVSIPNGATSISIVCLPASTNGVFTVDMLDCINELPAPCNTTSSINESACDSYTSPSGNYTWTTSGMYTDTIPNAAACDSIISIDLTVSNSSTGVDTATTCDSFTWIDGNTYTASNTTATYTLSNAAGCDSIVSLNLTILNSASSIDTQTACDSFTWIDGNTYTANNDSATFIIAGGAANFCDSLVRLNLTINSVNSAVTQTDTMLSANEAGVSYQWIDCAGTSPIIGETNQFYVPSANGDYAVIVTNNGCTDTSSCYTVTTVGLIETSFDNKLMVYPNPTEGNLSIDFGARFETIDLKLTDITGKLLTSKKYQQSQVINLRIEEPTGVYLLIIESGEKKALLRLIKK